MNFTATPVWIRTWHTWRRSGPTIHMHGRNDSDALFVTLQVNNEPAVCTLTTRQISLVTNAKSLGSMSKKDCPCQRWHWPQATREWKPMRYASHVLFLEENWYRITNVPHHDCDLCNAQCDQLNLWWTGPRFSCGSCTVDSSDCNNICMIRHFTGSSTATACWSRDHKAN